MIQFRGADWDKSLSDGIIKGMAIGNQVRESKAQYDYGKASDAAKGAYDTAMKEAGDDVAKQDAARRAFNTSMNQAAFDYNKYTGRVNEADAAQRRMTQEDFRAGHMQQWARDNGEYGNVAPTTQWTPESGFTGGGNGAPTTQWTPEGGFTGGPSRAQAPAAQAPAAATGGAPQGRMSQADFNTQFMAPYEKNHSYYDQKIVDDLNTDTIAKVQGIQYSLGRPGELMMSVNGKPSGAMQITDQMRAPFLKNLQDMEYAKYGGGAVGPQTAIPTGGRAMIKNAQDPSAMQLGGALGGGTPDPTVPSGEVAGGEAQLQTGRPQGMITADNVPVNYRDQYNTHLSPEDEAAYQAWAKKNGRENDVEDYDMRGAWLEAKQKGVSLEDGRGHYPDTYKKPNHPTFSDQSKYNGEGGVKGGTWSKTEDGRDVFTPNRDLSPQEQQSLKEYFAKNEPNAILNLGGNGTQAQAQAQAQQARPTPIQQARAARPQQGVVTTPNGNVSLNRQGHPTSAAEDAQAMLDAIRNGNLPKEMKPFYEFMVKNEARMQAYYNAFARAFGHWPTDYEKDKMLNIALGAEKSRHNKATEDLVRRGQDLSFLKSQKGQKPEEFKVSEEMNENGGYPILNESGFPIAVMHNVTEKGGKEAYPIITPPGWTKQRATALVNDLFGRFRGFKPSDIRTDPRSMRTLIRIGNEVFTVEGAEEMLAETANDVAKYKGSKAAAEDAKEMKRREAMRGITEKSKKAKRNEQVRKELYGGDITASQKPWRED